MKRKKAPNKQSLKRKATVEDRKADGERMMQLFQLHWDTHPDRCCESCGVQLFGENLTTYHEHLLQKGVTKRPDVKFEIDNLFLICSDCHSRANAGIVSEKHKQAIEEAELRFPKPIYKNKYSF